MTSSPKVRYSSFHTLSSKYSVHEQRDHQVAETDKAFSRVINMVKMVSQVKSKEHSQFHETAKCADCGKWHHVETVDVAGGFHCLLRQLGAMKCPGVMLCGGACIACRVELIEEHEIDSAVYKHEVIMAELKKTYQDPATSEFVRNKARLTAAEEKAIFHVVMAEEANKKPCLSYLDKCFRRCEWPSSGYVGYPHLWRNHTNYIKHDEWVEVTGECKLLIDPIWFGGTAVFQIPVEIQPEIRDKLPDATRAKAEIFVRFDGGRRKIGQFNLFSINGINKHGVMGGQNVFLIHLSIREMLSTCK